MTVFDAVPDLGLSWLDASGDHAEIVLSTRVRLARNLQGHAFGPRARVNDREAVLTQVRRHADRIESLDGATVLQRFRTITLPLLSPSTFFVIVISLINGFQVFDQVYVISSGGPAKTTLTVAYMVFQNGFDRSAMGLASATAIVLFIITFLTTRERIQPVRTEQASVRRDIGDLVRNVPWLILFVFGILFVTFTTLKNSVIMYYFTYYVGSVELAGLFMVINLLGAMAGAAATGILVRYMSKRTLMIASIFIGIGSSLLLYLPGPEDIVLMFVFGTLTEFSTGPMVTLFFAMLADTADYSEWKTNRRATGLFYSAGTVAMKFGSGVGGALTGFLLAAFGYVAASEAVMGQADSAIHGIRILISIVPAIVAVLMLIAFAFYRLDESLLTKIEHDLAAPRAAAAGDSLA